MKKRLGLFALALILVSQTVHAFTTIAAGVNGGVGIAFDSTANAAYYVDFNGGTLKRIHLTTPCSTTTTPCVIDTVASGFSHPEDVALDPAHGVAYVTTRDDPGTSGALWRVTLATGVKALVTFNLEAPQQIALDAAANTAYTVGYDGGRLWKIDLSSGSKTTVIGSLGHPVGVAMTSDRTRAYVTVQDSAKLIAIDLTLHVKAGDIVGGLTAPFFLSWTDPGQSALFLVERSPVNDVQRVDLPTSTKFTAIPGLPPAASAIAVDWIRSTAYITSNNSVVSVDLNKFVMSDPIFLGVGHVPFSDISADGYATTSTPQLSAKDAPFGGTMDIFGNLDNFKTTFTATHYRVMISSDGGVTFTPIVTTWSTERYNPATGKYEPVTVAPSAAAPGETAVTLFAIPPEYPSASWRWKPPYQMLRWSSGANGTFKFKVELYRQTGTTFTGPLPIPSGNLLALRIDNDAPDVDLLQVYQFVSGVATPVPACTIIQTPLLTVPPSKVQVGVKAYDANGHMLSYAVTAYWGHNKSGGVMSDTYAPGHVTPTRMWTGETNRRGPTSGWDANCNCAYTFYLDAWKRTINGYGLISYRGAHQSITIDNIAPITNVCP